MRFECSPHLYLADHLLARLPNGHCELRLLGSQSSEYSAPLGHTGHMTSSQIEICFREPVYISHAGIATDADILGLIHGMQRLPSGPWLPIPTPAYP
jgi:hypothetical protein